jgi:hypothetical protein
LRPVKVLTLPYGYPIYLFIVEELVLIDLKYLLFESGSKWKRKIINKSVSLPRRTDGLLIAFSTVVLTIKKSASCEAEYKRTQENPIKKGHKCIYQLGYLVFQQYMYCKFRNYCNVFINPPPHRL